jgi:hypothetical protein
MTKFVDGPAVDKTLMLKRSPLFLRVVECNGIFDALDQPSDTPSRNETIWAYRLAMHHGSVHINRGRNGSGFYEMADYKLVAVQPADATMRDGDAWEAWCKGAVDLL